MSAGLEPTRSSGWGLWIRQALFVALLLFCLVIPSSWTQGVLEDIPSTTGSAPDDTMTRRVS
jgi:hypothetical protein